MLIGLLPTRLAKATAERAGRQGLTLIKTKTRESGFWVIDCELFVMSRPRGSLLTNSSSYIISFYK